MTDFSFRCQLIESYIGDIWLGWPGDTWMEPPQTGDVLIIENREWNVKEVHTPTGWYTLEKPLFLKGKYKVVQRDWFVDEEGGKMLDVWIEPIMFFNVPEEHELQRRLQENT